MASVVKKTDTAVLSARQQKIYDEYKRLEHMRDLLNEQMAPLKEKLGDMFPEGVTYLNDKDGEKRVTRFPTSSSGSFDRKGLLADHPRIHAKYWTPGVQGAGTPRLTIY